MEEWRDIPNHAPYQASNLGRIRRVRGGMRNRTGILKLKRMKRTGYLSVSLSLYNVHVCRLVHRLVMLAFVGPSLLDVNHKNANRTDNRLQNLEYVTKLENVHHCMALGRHARGERIFGSKLTEAKVREIRKLHREGAVQRQLARDFQVTTTQINNVVLWKTWKHVEIPA